MLRPVVLGARQWRRIALAVTVCCQPGIAARADPPDAAFSSCERAGVAAEQAAGLPPGLLVAIGQVESGHRDPLLGRVIPWPWTIDVAGKGQWFETKDDAIRAVRAALDAGVRSIDAGCFQINLLHHPAAFTDLDQAFDPGANATYAARFLTELFARTGSWNGAVEAYHSSDPTLGFAYRQQVFAALLTQAPIAPPPNAPEAVVVSVPMPVVTAGVQVWTPMPAGTAPTSIAISIGGSPSPDASPPLQMLSAGLPIVVPHALMPKK
jgi:hypothetical protein